MQVILYPALGHRPEVEIVRAVLLGEFVFYVLLTAGPPWQPILDLAGKTFKKFLHFHHAVWALSTDGEVFGSVRCTERGERSHSHLSS